MKNELQTWSPPLSLGLVGAGSLSQSSELFKAGCQIRPVFFVSQTFEAAMVDQITQKCYFSIVQFAPFY